MLTMGRSRTTAVVVVALAPLAWAVHLGLSYWFVPVTCSWSTVAPMHLTTMGAVVVSLSVAVAGWRSQHGSTRGDYISGRELAATPDPALARLAIMLGLYFALVILLTGLVPVVVSPCA